jgi:hypothetical protein
MSNILVGNTEGTFVLAKVEGVGAQAKVEILVTMHKVHAREVYTELGRQLGAADAWEREESALARIAELERSNAALRGALTKRRMK